MYKGTYYLEGCKAEVQVEGKWTSTVLEGDYEIVEFMPYEPSAYVNSAGFLICPAGWDPEVELDDDHLWFVEEWDLIEQIDPPAYKRFVEQERAYERAQSSEAWERLGGGGL